MTKPTILKNQSKYHQILHGRNAVQISNKKGLNANQLKFIAIVSMTIDHFVSVVFPNYPTSWWIIALHIAGRLAAPIMWFFIAEGYHHTHDFRRYAGRLFLFAIISHFAYMFAFGIPVVPFKKTIFNQTSVIWALAWGLIGIYIKKSSQIKNWMKQVSITLICLITFCADWSCIAVLAIVVIGCNYGNLKKQMSGMVFYVTMYAIVYFLCINKVYGIIQMFVILTIPLLRRYNGERGQWNGMKYFFYLYYPLHLVVCGIVRILLYGNVGVMIGA